MHPAVLRTLAGGSGPSFSVLSCSEFSAVLESSEEDSYLRRDRRGHRWAGCRRDQRGLWDPQYLHGLRWG